MPAPSRRWLFVLVLAVGAAGFACYGVRSSMEPGFADRSEFPRALADRGPNDAELERRRQIAMRRSAAKETAVRELLAGRLTLAEAAVCFRNAEEETPMTWVPPRIAGVTDEAERLCRNVMDRAHYWVAENLPEATAHVDARLEAELQQLRGPDGFIRLPDE
jgi:hypothetical protein